MQQRTLASTNRQLKPAQSASSNNLNSASSQPYNVTLSPSAMQDVVEVRDRCVENIWDVTVSLNVLYRENWTR
jgi:hypothetical protein